MARDGMTYNPNIHHRRSIRLKEHDYSQVGLYFVTICCDGRKHRFGRVEDGEMLMNEYGTIAHNEWLDLAERFESVDMDVFQIMPNHIHGIMAIVVGAPLADAPGTDIADACIGAPPAPIRAPARGAPTVGDIVGAYKSLVANGCLKIYKSNGQMMGKLWQRNYWEHIVRNEQELFRIRQYIENNPMKWQYDKLNDGPGNRLLETPAEYGIESWMV